MARSAEIRQKPVTRGPSLGEMDRQIRHVSLQLLEHLAGLMLRAGIGAGELSDLCRRAFVATAARTLAQPNKKLNVSRIAVTTGLTRQEVARLLRARKPPRNRELRQLQRANRVLAGWHNDPDFSSSSGKPIALKIRGNGLSFHTLVRRYGGDVPPRAVLDELKRVGAVLYKTNDTLQPQRRSVELGRKEQTSLKEVAFKLCLLASTLTHNLQRPAAQLFESTAANQAIKVKHYPIAVRQLSMNAQKFVNATKQYLNRESRRAKAQARSGDRRSLGVGVFIFSEPR